MTGEEYLRSLLARVRAQTGILGIGSFIKKELEPVLYGWGGLHIDKIEISGSYAKDTAILGLTDVDLFISLKSTTPGTLSDIYYSLGNYLKNYGYVIRWQNVSIGITHKGFKVDLVPGKRQSFLTNDHSIYVSRRNTWTKTNVDLHISTIKGSLRCEEICILKQWKMVHGLSVPSFLIELSTLRALKYKPYFQLEDNILDVLRFFRDDLEGAALLDPANTNNNVANDITAEEKKAITLKAFESLNKRYWSEILW